MTARKTFNGSHTQRKCIDCTASPNPTKDRVELKVIRENGYGLRFKLFNLDGKLLKSRNIDSEVINLSIGNCEDGPYFLKVTSGNTHSEVIRILKT